MRDEPHPNWRITPSKRERAKGLRREMTVAERIVWAGIRNDQLGAGFRRQVPVGPYTVDFLSHEAKLVVEIDGGQHFHGAQQHRDQIRDAFLHERGFRVLRFANNDVTGNREGVLQTILTFLGLPPP